MFDHKVNDKLSIRRLSLKDAEVVFDLTHKNRSYLREWLPWVDATQSANDTAIFIQYAEKSWKKREAWHGCMVYEDMIVGCIGFHGFDNANKSTSIGYWLAETAQGKGIVTTSVKSLCHLAFKKHGFHRIELKAAVKNPKSQAIAERCGFQKEGVLRDAEWLNEYYSDLILYSLLSTDS